MKLFVWRNVLRDYSDGLVVVVAEDLRGALKAATDQIGYDWTWSDDDLTIIDDLNDLDEPFVAYVAGGS